MARVALLITLTGRVQGVGLRGFIRRIATRLCLDGWVRNRSDGSVEIMAIGERVTIERLIQACKGGPPLAQVAELTMRDAEDDGSKGFSESPTL
jgi:acylphosphatase